MNREQKAALIESLKNDFRNSEASFLVGYKGLSVGQMQTLRRAVRAKGGKLKVAKNRLVRRAVSEVDGVCALEDHLKEQLGVVFAADEFTQVAKALAEFSKENPALTLVSGCLGAEVIDKAKISQLALLPSADVLLGQLAGTLQAPTTKLAALLNTMVVRLLWTLKQVGDKKQ